MNYSESVAMKGPKFNPFSGEVSIYIDEIDLNENEEIILSTSFTDTSEKLLRSCISDLEIDFYGLIDLLELLKGVAGKSGVLSSILKPVNSNILLMSKGREMNGFACAKTQLAIIDFMLVMKMVI